MILIKSWTPLLKHSSVERLSFIHLNINTLIVFFTISSSSTSSLTSTGGANSERPSNSLDVHIFLMLTLSFTLVREWISPRFYNLFHRFNCSLSKTHTAPSMEGGGQDWGAGCFWLLGAGAWATWKKIQEPEPETLKVNRLLSPARI